jgi:hypothetical protein
MEYSSEHNLGESRKTISKQVWTVATLAAFAVLALLSVAIVLAPPRSGPATRQEFDSAAWKDETKVQQGRRLQLADSLIKQGTLHNKTRTEVIALLGEPSQTNYFRNWDLVYWLGSERAFISIDSEWLVVRLDANGRVAEYRIISD